jgi:O-antigen ligase
MALAFPAYKAHGLLAAGIVIPATAIMLDSWWPIFIGLLAIGLISIFKPFIQHTTTLFWMALVAIPCSTEIMVTPTLGLDAPLEPFLILLSCIAVLQWMHFPSSNVYKPVLESNLITVLLLHILWLGINCFFSSYPLLSIKFLLAKIWYIIPCVVLLPMVLTSPRKIRVLALCIAVPTLLLCVQVLIRHALLGFSFQGIKDVMNPFFRNHVNYSGLLACMVPIWFTLHQLAKQKKYQRLLLAALLITILALLLAYSRGAILALVMGATAWWCLKKKRLVLVFGLAALAGFMALVYFYSTKKYLLIAPQYESTIYQNTWNKHLQATVAWKDISNAERIHRWIAGMNMFADKPVTGYGTNSFNLLYKKYTEPAFKTYVSNNTEQSTVHNNFLLVAIEQGIFGCLIWLGVLMLLLSNIQHNYNRSASLQEKYTALTLAAIVLTIVTLNCFNDLIETDKIGGIFWLCVGLVVHSNYELSMRYRKHII